MWENLWKPGAKERHKKLSFSFYLWEHHSIAKNQPIRGYLGATNLVIRLLEPAISRRRGAKTRRVGRAATHPPEAAC